MPPAALSLGPGDIVLWFGIFAALLLALMAFLRIRENPTVNAWLLVFLLATLGGILLKFVDYHALTIEFPHLFRLNHPIGLCRPIALFLYVSALLDPQRILRPRDLLHFLPVVLVVIYLWPLLSLSATDKVAVMEGRLYVPRAYLPFGYGPATLVYSLAYWGLTFRAYWHSELRAAGNRRSRQAERMRRWILALLAGGFLFLLLVSLTLATGRGPGMSYLLFQYMSVLMVLACLLLLLVSTQPTASGGAPPRYEKSTLGQEERSTHAAALERRMAEGAIYRRSGLRLADLARELELPEYVLSQVINEEFHETFSEYVNRYRIEAAKEMLRSGDYAHLTMEGIGQEVGFRSRARFYDTFKRSTGVTPARYRDGEE